MKRKRSLLVIFGILSFVLIIIFTTNNQRSFKIVIDNVVIKPWHTKMASLINAGYVVNQKESGNKTAVGLNITCTEMVLTKGTRKIKTCVLNGESSHAAIKNIEDGYIVKLVIQEGNLENVLYNGLKILDFSKEDLKLQFDDVSITPISLELYEKGCKSSFYYRAKKLYKLEVVCTY